MVKLLCLGLFIRWDKADKDRGPLQQGQAARTWGSVTWHSHGISCNHSASRRKKNTQSRERLTQYCTAPSTTVSFNHRTSSSVVSVVWNWWVSLAGKLYAPFPIQKQVCHGKSLFFSLEIYCCEDLNMCWLTHFTLRMLTTVSCSQDLLINQTEDPASLFKKPWWYPVYSAISWGSHHTLFGLIRWKHEDHLQLY